MSSLQEVLATVNKAIKEPIDWKAVDTAMIELHNKLTEPKWAIEDEALREETEKLLVQMASQSYLKRHITKSKIKDK